MVERYVEIAFVELVRTPSSRPKIEGAARAKQKMLQVDVQDIYSPAYRNDNLFLSNTDSKITTAFHNKDPKLIGQ